MRTPEEISEEMKQSGISYEGVEYVPLRLVIEWFKSVTEQVYKR